MSTPHDPHGLAQPDLGTGRTQHGDAPGGPAMPDMPRDPVRTRGRYVFTLDDEPAGIDERFVLGDIAPGVVRARTTRVLAQPVGRLESDARLEPGRLAVAIRWTGSADGVVREGAAELTEDAGGVTASRSVEGTAYGVSHLPGRINATAHVLAGPLMSAAVGGVDVVEPDVLAPADPVAFLAPVATHWTCVDAGPTAVEVDGVERAGTSYLWTDRRTGLDAHVVVDEGGLLLRSRLAAPDGLLEVHLAEVTGPWPTPTTWLTA